MHGNFDYDYGPRCRCRPLIGSALAEPMDGAILLALISGITCIIYTIDNRKEQRTPKEQIF
ncbi:MAG: hypothetical protein EGQ73_00690 [Clostridiales bacterium]|nr:hypothetical protein [Clostridiales bacterium]